MATALETTRAQFKRRLLFGGTDTPLSVICGHCDRYIQSDVPWRCGSCGHENRRTSIYSFVNKCQMCGNEPPSYVCPHDDCREVNHFGKDHDAGPAARPFFENKAKRLSQKKAPSPPPPETLETKSEREHAAQKRALVHEEELEIIRSRLRKLRLEGEKPQEETGRDRMKKRIRAYLDHFLDGRLAAKDVEAEAEKELKDSPELLRDAKEAIRSFLEEEYQRRGG